MNRRATPRPGIRQAIAIGTLAARPDDGGEQSAGALLDSETFVGPGGWARCTNHCRDAGRAR